MPNSARNPPGSPAAVESRIFVVRGQRILLDEDLAALYGVKTKQLNLAVKRNEGRFPADFMFRLSPREAKDLRFQIETSRSRATTAPSRGGGRSAPVRRCRVALISLPFGFGEGVIGSRR